MTPVLRRLVLLLVLVHERDLLVSAFGGGACVLAGGPPGLSVGARARTSHLRTPQGLSPRRRHASALHMSGGSLRGADVEGPFLGERPCGPDPFRKVHHDMQRIKAKIKNIADRAMSTSSKIPFPILQSILRASPLCWTRMVSRKHRRPPTKPTGPLSQARACRRARLG